MMVEETLLPLVRVVNHVLGEVSVDVPVLLVLNDVLCIDGLQ